MSVCEVCGVCQSVRVLWCVSVCVKSVVYVSL